MAQSTSMVLTTVSVCLFLPFPGRDMLSLRSRQYTFIAMWLSFASSVEPVVKVFYPTSREGFTTQTFNHPYICVSL